jgi:hypothetical protein
VYLPSVTSFCVDGGMVVVGAGMVVVIADKYIETWVSNRRCSAMCTTYKQILGYTFQKIFWKQTFDNNGWLIRSRNRFSFSSSLPVLLIFLVSCAFFYFVLCVFVLCLIVSKFAASVSGLSILDCLLHFLERSFTSSN